MNIELVRLTLEYKDQLFDMLTEWKTDIEENHTNHSPWAIFRNDFHDFDYYLENLEIKKETEEGRVPDNIGSAKSIIRNGGVLENEVEEDGHLEQRYWIQL